MGAKHSFRSLAGGGVSLFVCSPAAPRMLPGCSFPLPFPLSSWRIFRQSGQIFSKKGQKLDFICLLWCFLGKIGDRERQKPNIFLKYGCKVGAGCGSACPTFGVPTGCRWCRVQGFRLSLGVFPAFCPLSRFSLGALLANMALFRVLRQF